MGVNSLLLIVIIWLLWSIHQSLLESNDRQRSIKNALSKLANRFDQPSSQIKSETNDSVDEAKPHDTSE